MRETIDRMTQPDKVIDCCARTPVNTRKDALLITQIDASESNGYKVEQSMVDRSSSTGEISVGTDSEHEE